MGGIDVVHTTSKFRQSSVFRSVVFGSLAVVMLTACSGGDDEETGAQDQPAAGASGQAQTSGWNVDAGQEAKWTAELDDITAEVKKLEPKLADKNSDAYIEATVAQMKQGDRLSAVVEEMTLATDVTGIGHVACAVLPTQLVVQFTGADKDKITVPDRGATIGMIWLSPVNEVGQAADPLALDVTFKDVNLDAQLQQECPEVRQEVLDYTELTSIDDLYDSARNL